MKTTIIIIGLLITAFIIWSRFFGGWRAFHQRIAGFLLLAYSAYLATLTGSLTQFVLPGLGAIGGGAATGAGIGLVSWLFIGTVGVATGGVGLAVGAPIMALIGGALGAAGAATGGAGFTRVTYPLVSPLFWIPLVALGCYLLFFSRKKQNPKDKSEE